MSLQLFVHVKNACLDYFLAKLAAAHHAEWKLHDCLAAGSHYMVKQNWAAAAAKHGMSRGKASSGYCMVARGEFWLQLHGCSPMHGVRRVDSRSVLGGRCELHDKADHGVVVGGHLLVCSVRMLCWLLVCGGKSVNGWMIGGN